MPLPKPKDDESKDDFLKRCMANPTMNKEYDDNDQRYAVCNSLWKQAKEKKEAKEMGDNDIERRFLVVENLEVRRGKDGDVPKYTGYVARFDKLSDDLGGFREKIAPGAFRNTIARDDIRALFNHDPNFVLGRTSVGTLSLFEDKRGLRMEVEPPDAQWAKDLTVSIERGDISQQSFGFNTLHEEWDESKKTKIVRTLHEVQLFDVGPVTFAAYPQTKVQVRSLEGALAETGVDTDKVSRVLLKAEHGLEITNDDRQAVDEVIERLRAVIPEEQQGNDEQDETDQTPMHRVGLMRKKLELKLKCKEDI